MKTSLSVSLNGSLNVKPLLDHISLFTVLIGSYGAHGRVLSLDLREIMAIWVPQDLKLQTALGSS